MPTHTYYIYFERKKKRGNYLICRKKPYCCVETLKIAIACDGVREREREREICEEWKALLCVCV